MEYNNLGQLKKRTDRNGTVFGYQYDEIGQAVVCTLSKTINNTVQTQESRFIFGSNITGGINQRISETYTNGTKTATQILTTDSLNRNRIIDSTVGSRRTYTRVNTDASSRITQFNDYFNNFYTNYQYDKLRLDKVQTDGNSALNSSASANVQYSYFDNGPVQGVTYPPLSDSSILKTEYTYNKALNLVATVTNTKGGSNLSKYEYGYDKNGNIITVTETLYSGAAQTTSYAYDALNRLTNVIRPAGAGTTTYTYDLRGNRLTLSDTVATNLETVDTSYTYDLLNTLTSVTKGSSTTNFGYYANGLRVQKNTGSIKTEYNYNFNGEVIYEGKSTAQKASYVRGDRVLVKKDVTNASQIKDYYYLYNGHGDVVQIVDTSGKVVNSYAYDVWGNTTSQTEGISNPFKYTGEVYDEETGLYYLRARYYDPSIGRFLNEDTYEGQIDNPLSLNLYTYVSNNPLIYSDPTGHMMTRGADSIGGDGGASGASSEYKAFSEMNQFELTQIMGDERYSSGVRGAAAAEFIKRNFMLVENGAVRAASGAITLIKNANKVLEAAAMAKKAKLLTKQSVDDKLARYLLNQDHPVGGSKAKWFKEALGFTQNNADDLARQIVFDPKKAIQTGVNEYGIKYNQVISIQGANGKIIDVTFAWLMNNDAVVKLVTAIPTKK